MSFWFTQSVKTAGNHTPMAVCGLSDVVRTSIQTIKIDFDQGSEIPISDVQYMPVGMKQSTKSRLFLLLKYSLTFV